jgi:hypothetical protein
MSESVKGCLSFLANEVEVWLRGRSPNRKDLLILPADGGHCEDGAGEAACKLVEDFFSPTGLVKTGTAQSRS